ncbi:YczE/YyaS/YitT family protein [Mycoplasma sp. P36-A1]|uniref:YczE/YyaS/YitT family protein n=1 Tax=Mycoplasma sp. P36-A1 TaxID=3252900 RepID=UPI003C2EE026
MNKELLILTIKRCLFLFIGVNIMTLGVALIMKAEIGVQPWDVFHQGLSSKLGISFGQASIYVGYCILALSALIKIFPGPGTIFNIMYMGIAIDIMMPLVPVAPNFYIGVIMNVSGAIILAAGTALYLKSTYGAGARDALIMGIVHKYKKDTKFVKPAIEAVVLITGIILGGNFGVGTFISLIFVGYFIDIFFNIFQFDPKITKQMTFLDFFNKEKGILANEDSSN